MVLKNGFGVSENGKWVLETCFGFWKTGNGFEKCFVENIHQES